VALAISVALSRPRVTTGLPSTRRKYSVVNRPSLRWNPAATTSRRGQINITSNTIFMHRVLVARSALKTVDLAIDVAGGAAYFRKLGLERHFRDIQGARFHPIAGAPQRRLAGRMALGLPIDA